MKVHILEIIWSTWRGSIPDRAGKNQDVVALASYAPLFEHVHYHSWSPNLIRFQNAESFGIPTYYVWKMFGKTEDHM